MSGPLILPPREHFQVSTEHENALSFLFYRIFCPKMRSWNSVHGLRQDALNLCFNLFRYDARSTLNQSLVLITYDGKTTLIVEKGLNRNACQLQRFGHMVKP
jgi:hypothetical protein